MKSSNWLNVVRVSKWKSPYPHLAPCPHCSVRPIPLPNPVCDGARHSQRCSRDAVNNLPDHRNYPSCSFIPSILGLTAEPQLNSREGPRVCFQQTLAKHRWSWTRCIWGLPTPVWTGDFVILFLGKSFLESKWLTLRPSNGSRAPELSSEPPWCPRDMRNRPGRNSWEPAESWGSHIRQGRQVGEWWGRDILHFQLQGGFLILSTLRPTVRA